MIKPYAHQQKVVDLNPDRHLLAWQTQVGKTLAAIWVANRKGCPALIVTKKGLVEQWKIELDKHFKHEYLLLSKENFAKQWNTLPKYETVIVDEVHYFLGQQTKGKRRTMTMAGTLARHLKKYAPKYRYFLSATPYTSTPWSIYRLAQFLGKTWKYQKFADYFFSKKRQRFQRCPKGKCIGCKLCEREILKIRIDRKSEVKRIGTGLGSAVKMKNCYDMPKDLHVDIHLDLTAEQNKAIRENSDINNRVASHRIEVGHISGNGYMPDIYLKNEISDKILEYAGEYDKLAVVCRFRTQVSQIAASFPNRKVVILWGGMNDFHQKRVETEEADNCICVIQADCSEGYPLHSFEAMVFASCSYSWVSFEQIHGRLRYVGRKSPCLYIYLTTGKTGKKILENVRNKKDFNP